MPNWAKFSLLLAVLFLQACASSNGVRELADGTEVIERPYPTPSWVSRNAPVHANGVHEFMGVSETHDNEKAARQAALTHAIEQYLMYVGADVSIFNEYYQETEGYEGDLVRTRRNDKKRIEIEVEAIIDEVKDLAWYTYERRKPNGVRQIEARVLVQVSEAQVQALKEYAEQKRLARITPILNRYRDLMKTVTYFDWLANRGKLVQAHMQVDGIEREFKAIQSMEYFDWAQPEIVNNPNYRYPLDRTPLMVSLVHHVNIKKASTKQTRPSSEGMDLSVKVERLGKAAIAVPMVARLPGGREVLSYTDDKGIAYFDLPGAKTRGTFPIEVALDLPEMKVEDVFYVKTKGYLPKAALGIDWYNGFIQAKGIGSVGKKDFASKWQGEQMALRAAELEAFSQISAMVTCAHVSQFVQVNSTRLHRSVVRNEVQATLRDTETKHSKVTWMNGVPVAEAIVRAPLDVNASINLECAM